MSRSTRHISPYPRDAREALDIPFLQDRMLAAVSAGARAFGAWKYPVTSDGCFEHMNLMDKVRYIHKAQHPVTLEEPGSGVQAHLRRHGPARLRLPSGFQVTDRMTLNAVGDLIPHDLLPASGETHYGGFGDLLFGADISFANLEAPIIAQPFEALKFRRSQAPLLGMSRVQFDILKGANKRRFTVMATACNHTLDYGVEGLSATLDTLDEAGIRAVGTSRPDAGPAGGLRLEVNGLRIGVVAATFGLNGRTAPPGQAHCVNVIPFTRTKGEIDLALFRRQIGQLRRQGCELVIASVHWGKEYEFIPTARQVALGHEIADLGADIILGHHPHNIQPLEIHRTAEGRQAVICHSLGNLTSPLSAPYLVTSLLVRIKVVRGILDGRQITLLEEAEPIPVFQDCIIGGEHAYTRLMPLKQALCSAAQKDSAAAGASYADLVLGTDWRSAQ